MDMRERLIAVAVDLLAAGPDAVQLRKVAADAGTSTMAVYTHFGGLSGLVQAMVRDGFLRLGAALSAVGRSTDPVADLVALGLAYREYALLNPELYRLMFGVTAVRGHRVGLGDPVTHAGDTRFRGDVAAAALAAFDTFVAFVETAAAAGRVSPEPPRALAGQLWSAMHGYVLLEISGFSSPEGLAQVLTPMMTKILAVPDLPAPPT
ncbi:TetR/AcrR family transcriptional regulator [Amycolatopsis rhizosphaerae]|nr:TetR/AcrR family transcriptional regulator [Amycolatopsis rhizosphaerae]